MKKVISIAIALALCFGLFYVPSGAVEAMLDAETAEAYADIMTSYFGGATSYTSTGLWVKYAKLLDMDRDGSMELIVISVLDYGNLNGSTIPETTFEMDNSVSVWTIKNGSAERVIHEVLPISMAGNIGRSFKINLVRDGINTYVHVCENGVDGDYGAYATWDKDTVIGVDGIKFQDRYYCYNEYLLSDDGLTIMVDEEGNAIINKKTYENGVTEEEHEQNVSAYFKTKTTEEINWDFGKEHSPTYAETMRQLLNACIRTDNTATATKYGTYQIVNVDSQYSNFIISFDAAMVERKTISLCFADPIYDTEEIMSGRFPFEQVEIPIVTVRPDSMIHVLSCDQGFVGLGATNKLPDGSYAIVDAIRSHLYTGTVKDDAEQTYYNFDKNINFISKEDGGNIYTNGAIYLIRLGDPVPALPFTIDYSQASTFTEPQQYIDALTDALTDAERLTDEGSANLTTYLNYATVNSAGVTISAKNNIAEIPEAKAGEVATKAREIYDTLKAVVDEHGIEFQRVPEVTARIHIAGLDWSNPVQLQIDREAVSAAEDADVLLLTLGDLQHTVRIRPSDFEGASGVILQIEPSGENEYHIAFLDEDGNLLDRIQTPVTIALPAPDKLATVQAVHAGATDNWGGQYDGQNGSIAFQTAFSGDYTVLEQPVQISDIGNLSEEQQAIIAFMVSKGYFSTDSDGNFNPNKVLSRYHLAAALVRIFFALDRDLETTFSDVPADSIYYPYVASGQANEIINGFEDGTYRGDTDVLRSQLIALCSRTLANKKGYAYPEDVEGYLNFADKDAIKEWARKEVALAVREGLIESGGRLEPEQPITRAEAAEMLYRLFMLLYEVAPAPMTEVEEAEPAPMEPEIAEIEITNEQPIRESAEKTERLEENMEEKNPTSRLPWILVSLGGIAILASGILLMKKQRKQ